VRALPLALSAALASLAALAEEQAPPPASPAATDPSNGLPKVRGLEFQFHLDASWGAFGFLKSFYANARPDQPPADLGDNWYEGAVKPGLSATWSHRRFNPHRHRARSERGRSVNLSSSWQA